MSASDSEPAEAQDVVMEEENESIDREEQNSVKEESFTPVQELTIDNIEDDNQNVTFTFFNEDHTLGNVSHFIYSFLF